MKANDHSSIGIPRWNLSSIFPALDSPEFETGLQQLDAAIASARGSVADTDLRSTDPGGWLKGALRLRSDAEDLYETLESFCYASYSVDTGNTAATTALNRVVERSVPLATLSVEFRNALASLSPAATALADGDSDLAPYRPVLEEELLFATRQMSAAEEALAADLNRSGANAWSRLQETVSSTLSATWDEGEQKTVVELRALAFDPHRETRKRAYNLELQAWKSVETPLSFALNGVKGATQTLNSRRGWSSTLERSARQNRLSTRALEAMLDTMRDALPVFHRYLRAKARVLELPILSFYDLFAPVGASSTTWSFATAVEFIAQRCDSFDPEQGAFVRRAVESRWIDAEPRPGKVGGAYCIDYPVPGESRILANFDGTYDGMSTLAHELGHAWHSEQLRDLPALQRHYPMTLAETASIFSETLVFFGAKAQAEGAEKLYILEQFLQGTTQVIVDILSRFTFESAVMDIRRERELSAREFCDLMVEAQTATYGEAVQEQELHPYMWAVKGHYYSADLAFYNFPYAFGQLFGLGLYGAYEAEPDGFATRYRAILRETGRADAVSVTAGAGFDIEDRAFWQSGIDRIAALVDEFEKLAEQR